MNIKVLHKVSNKEHVYSFILNEVAYAVAHKHEIDESFVKTYVKNTAYMDIGLIGVFGHDIEVTIEEA
jgi:hypothetical protein